MIVFILLTLLFWYIGIKNLGAINRMKKYGVRLTGTVKAIFEANSGDSRGASGRYGRVAIVEFDSSDLLAADLPIDKTEYEVSTKNAAQEGDSLECVIYRDNGAAALISTVPEKEMNAILLIFALFFSLAVVIKLLTDEMGGFVFGLMAGLVLICISGNLFCSLIKYGKKNALEITGEITRVLRKSGNKGRPLYGFEYTFFYNGKKYKKPEPSSYKSYRRRKVPMEGDEITVYFNEKNGEYIDGTEYKTLKHMGTVLLLAGIGIIAFLIAFPS